MLTVEMCAKLHGPYLTVIMSKTPPFQTLFCMATLFPVCLILPASTSLAPRRNYSYGINVLNTVLSNKYKISLSCLVKSILARFLFPIIPVTIAGVMLVSMINRNAGLLQLPSNAQSPNEWEESATTF
jgi:hypothetical protein